ncbi:MAG: ribosome biogenesis GTP-binding protein YihA/YsxC [Oligoflexia bacterium]|nr:ribosome biogenesis GTP-binding protein YihA/YsxC [Oligoflexia bacterium]
MSGQFVVTVGAIENLERLFSGKNLKGQPQPRIAMVGRSNVGKSSLINSLLESKVAQVSNQPGKTRCIHFYLWKEAKKVIADLPGYGYARTAQTERDRWAEFINAYLRADENLEAALVLLDARHGPTRLDEQAIRFLSFEGIPVTFVFTKFDQLKSQSERAQRKREASQALRDLGFDPEGAHWVSSRSGDGLKKLAAFLSR